ncbi:MAG: hypothetical protein JWR28_3494 [Modestobacter sp.]|jgi:hypothetical protein|nr:hypothetical protein [Modestobacter sp.]MCW2578299.1 hypothetical protein [Modestobacter sp.]MCW2620345.1 hypothetical protein [Modestobacter sp.]
MIIDDGSAAGAGARLVDRVEIEDLARRYAHGIDERNWDQVDACFRPDADVTGTQYSGRYPQYIAMLRPAVERYGTTMHFFGNQLTEMVDGETARTTTYGIAYHLGSTSGTEDFVMGVRYRDEVTRSAGTWQIRHRTVQAIWRQPVGAEIQSLLPAR